ncbi:hypothetical protein AN221_33705 [Streptomyces nanshensis]|uniref:Uncharacterized protein n=1 Tax=Streptomyces nanshensis TaxID=518642 RepID=A0A1E7LK17_9ACTN|nr:hypothetical protein AN221_33705 [Streptomyces nanshensis]
MISTIRTAAPDQPVPSRAPPTAPPSPTLAFFPAAVNAYHRSSSSPCARSATNAGHDTQYTRSAHSTTKSTATSEAWLSTSR